MRCCRNTVHQLDPVLSVRSARSACRLTNAIVAREQPPPTRGAQLKPRRARYVQQKPFIGSHGTSPVARRFVSRAVLVVRLIRRACSGPTVARSLWSSDGSAQVQRRRRRAYAPRPLRRDPRFDPVVGPYCPMSAATRRHGISQVREVSAKLAPQAQPLVHDGGARGRKRRDLLRRDAVELRIVRKPRRLRRGG